MRGRDLFLLRIKPVLDQDGPLPRVLLLCQVLVPLAVLVALVGGDGVLGRGGTAVAVAALLVGAACYGALLWRAFQNEPKASPWRQKDS